METGQVICVECGTVVFSGSVCDSCGLQAPRAVVGFNPVGGYGNEETEEHPGYDDPEFEDLDSFRE